MTRPPQWSLRQVLSHNAQCIIGCTSHMETKRRPDHSAKFREAWSLVDLLRHGSLRAIRTIPGAPNGYLNCLPCGEAERDAPAVVTTVTGRSRTPSRGSAHSRFSCAPPAEQFDLAGGGIPTCPDPPIAGSARRRRLHGAGAPRYHSNEPLRHLGLRVRLGSP